jgi:hypothetical protein
LHRYTYIHLAIQQEPSSVQPNRSTAHEQILIWSYRLFLRSVNVDGAHSLGSVRATLGLLARLVGLVNGNGVPGGAVGHALLLGGDLALLVGVGLGEARLGRGAL